jgi:hypothetical protein
MTALTGLSSERKLAGLAILSGWTPIRNTLKQARPLRVSQAPGCVGKVATRESALARLSPVLTRLTAVWFVLKSENHNTGSPVVLYIERMMTPLNLSVCYDYIINVVCHSGAWLVYMLM